jgi:hypothetical protein
LSLHKDPISAFLWTQLSDTTQGLINSDAGAYRSSSLISSLVSDLNAVISGSSIYAPATFANIALTQPTKQLIATNPTGADLLDLNRLLLEQAYPLALADLALAFDNGLADLSRCTVIGPTYVHRIEASECILDNVVIVENTQDGCVRFSATAQGSVIPRQYESVQTLPNAPLFTSRAFGQPGYAQLLDSVDNAVLPGPATGAVTVPAISVGAEDGSEMGAFAGQNNPIKEHSLLVKYQEYMPLGLTPLIIHAT